MSSLSSGRVPQTKRAEITASLFRKRKFTQFVSCVGVVVLISGGGGWKEVRHSTENNKRTEPFFSLKAIVFSRFGSSLSRRFLYYTLSGVILPSAVWRKIIFFLIRWQLIFV